MRKVLLTLFAAAFALCASTAHAQIGDISLAGGATFFDGGTPLGGSIWAKFDVSENVQLGVITGYFSENDDTFLGDVTSYAVPIFGTVTYNFHGETVTSYIGANVGVYLIGISGDNIDSDSESYVSLGLISGLNFNVGESVFILVRTGLDLFYIPGETITTAFGDIVVEGSTEVAIPLVAGVGFRF